MALHDLHAQRGEWTLPAPLSAAATALFADAARTLAPRTPERDRALVASWMHNADVNVFCREGRQLVGFTSGRGYSATFTPRDTLHEPSALLVVGEQTEALDWVELDAVVAWIGDIIDVGEGDITAAALYPGDVALIDCFLAEQELPSLVRTLIDLAPEGALLTGTRKAPEEATLILDTPWHRERIQVWYNEIAPRVHWRTLRYLASERAWNIRVDGDGVTVHGLSFT